MTEIGNEAEVKREIVNFLQGVSISITPDAAEKVADFREHVRPETTIFVGLLPGGDYHDVVRTARKLHEQGFRVVPHFTARNIAGPKALEDYLESVCEVAAVEEVLVLAGDVASPIGDYHCSMQLLETGLFDQYGIKRIGVAGHPEGTSDIGAYDLKRALAQKNAFARQTDAEMYILTQFCFDAETIIDWEKRINAAGNRLPICAGIAGPMELAALIRIAAKCKIGDSMRMLTRLAGSLAKSGSLRSPDRIVARLAGHHAKQKNGAIQRAHVFTFGNVAKASHWINAGMDGNFTMQDEGRAFSTDCFSEPKAHTNLG